MGQNSPAPSTKLGKNMRQLVTQRPVGLAGMMDKFRIESDQFRPMIRAPRARFQSWVPLHANFIRDTRCAMRAKERTSNLQYHSDVSSSPTRHLAIGRRFYFGTRDARPAGS
jgi:hypothetical protein